MAKQVERCKDKMILELLRPEDREQFIIDNQEAFNYGALEEFGARDKHFEEGGQIISRKTIEASIENGIAYRIIQDGEKVGGAVIRVEEEHGDLELLFTSPKSHGKGIGQSAWFEIERVHPKVKVWETVTPYFEKRNIHFYVNRCGFKIVEFFDSRDDNSNVNDKKDYDFFRFEKIIK